MSLAEAVLGGVNDISKRSLKSITYEALEDLRESGEQSNSPVVGAFRTIATLEYGDDEGVLPERRERAFCQ